MNRVGLEHTYAINGGVRRHAYDIDVVVPSANDARDVCSVTVEVLAGTAKCTKGIDAWNFMCEEQIRVKNAKAGKEALKNKK